ncbi:MAG: hypothetical protein JSS82_13890 [Bacteroidetes bacterium]|nr:hypothetical protein [Bacteroidota bacterium]
MEDASNTTLPTLGDYTEYVTDVSSTACKHTCYLFNSCQADLGFMVLGILSFVAISVWLFACVLLWFYKTKFGHCVQKWARKPKPERYTHVENDANELAEKTGVEEVMTASDVYIHEDDEL